MTAIIIIAIALALVIAAITIDHRRNPRIRMVEWNKRQRYIRVYPNPGFQIGQRHWCRAKGRRGH